MISAPAALASFSRIVVKIGTQVLIDGLDGQIRVQWLEGLCAEISALCASGTQVTVVSSGAVGLGRSILDFGSRNLRLDDLQAAAAVGQIRLAQAWAEALALQNLTMGQILLTFQDTEERRRYLNARSTISNLFQFGAVPVVNENDTVATESLRYGDNDRLAARVAMMIGADLLVLLSDVKGLYLDPTDTAEEPISNIRGITPDIEALARDTSNPLGTGGMVTKIAAAKIAAVAGCQMIIASGRECFPLGRIDSNRSNATWFEPELSPRSARKAWIAGSLSPQGVVVIDDGAVAALQSGSSLLPAGILRVEGTFSRGDAVLIDDASGGEIGRGLSAYDSRDAACIAGRRSGEIAAILGYCGRSEMIHRDDLALVSRVGPRSAEGPEVPSV